MHRICTTPSTTTFLNVKITIASNIVDNLSNHSAPNAIPVHGYPNKKKDQGEKVRLTPDTYWLALQNEENRNWASLGRIHITVWGKERKH
jgi:hypothetical protein